MCYIYEQITHQVKLLKITVTVQIDNNNNNYTYFAIKYTYFVSIKYFSILFV